MNEIVIFDAGEDRIEVRLEAETVWLSLLQLTELFGRDKSVISRHLRNLFREGELRRESVVAKEQQLLPMAKYIRWSTSTWM